MIKPLSKVTTPESIGESYRYEYAPLILLAIEKRFGQSIVQKLLQLCLSETQPATNYLFLKTNIIKAGVSEKDWSFFENHVIDQAACKNIFNYL